MSRFERPELLVSCGIIGLCGAIAPIILNTIGASVAEHDFLADTISDLGRGPHKWIMDTGFYINAAGLLALSTAAAHAHLGRLSWSVGILALQLTALVTVLLGVWDNFGNGEDLSIHSKLTFLLGPLYLAGPLLMAVDIRTDMPRIALLFVASAVLWAVLAAAFKLAPDSFDSALEKLAVLATMLWTIPLSWVMFQRGRGRSFDA